MSKTVNLFDDLTKGLQQAIDYHRGIGEAKVYEYTINPVKKVTGRRVRSVRTGAGMTQAVFANYMGVSPKTVEAWERGRTNPTGSACRLMELLEADMAVPFACRIQKQGAIKG